MSTLPSVPVQCAHRVVPIDRDWGRCTKCGDSTFPLSQHSAGEWTAHCAANLDLPWASTTWFYWWQEALGDLLCGWPLAHHHCCPVPGSDRVEVAPGVTW